MIFSSDSHARLSELFRVPGSYPGYKPDQFEAPNGDGIVDTGKRYLHVALKYDPPEWARWYLARAHFEACRVAEALKVPDAFYPRVEDGTLRVLEYPPGAGSAEHTDFDLFTLTLWRSSPDVELFGQTSSDGGDWVAGMGDRYTGELGQLVGLGPATPHRVPARPYAQKAIVYFAMPAGEARLRPGGPHAGSGFGPTVNEWMAERYSRSRVYK